MSMNQSDAGKAAHLLYMAAMEPSMTDVEKLSLLRVVAHMDTQIARMNQPLFNPSAFPVDYVPGVMNGEPGMSLRDYFAAKALQGLLANPGCDYTPMTATAQAQSVADAYGLADAMLKERDK